ncbi:hypothetical protein [Streptomyces sp. NPDC020983]|uniref:hypothetical protein n=1 Tax=Streptomyces sp. NPDC020983 TaxID=3365106 RepID=UPI0037A595E3
MNPLDFVSPAARARRNAHKEAAQFALKVKPGHTYYSIVENHARHPGAPARLLMEWRFSRPGRWIGQEARCGHLTAAGAWLGYGPLHEDRPAGLLTFAEAGRRAGVGAPEFQLMLDLVPAGV